MSKRNKPVPVNLQDFKDKQYREGRIPVDAGGKIFYITPASLLPDDKYRELMAIPSEDMIAQARMTMENYDEFVEAGGSATLISAIIEAHSKGELYGEDEGEGEASSDS